MTTRTTIRLPDELLAQAKRKATAEGRTFTSVVEQGLRIVVAEPPVERKPRVMPRISTARGGLRPGIDPLSFSALEEADDMEYVERMNAGFK